MSHHHQPKKRDTTRGVAGLLPENNIEITIVGLFSLQDTTHEILGCINKTQTLSCCSCLHSCYSTFILCEQ